MIDALTTKPIKWLPLSMALMSDFMWMDFIVVFLWWCKTLLTAPYSTFQVTLGRLSRADLWHSLVDFLIASRINGSEGGRYIYVKRLQLSINLATPDNEGGLESYTHVYAHMQSLQRGGWGTKEKKERRKVTLSHFPERFYTWDRE